MDASGVALVGPAQRMRRVGKKSSDCSLATLQGRGAAGCMAARRRSFVLQHFAGSRRSKLPKVLGHHCHTKLPVLQVGLCLHGFAFVARCSRCSRCACCAATKSALTAGPPFRKHLCVSRLAVFLFMSWWR